MKKITILTGAGISAESGIPTFRDSGGLWEGYKVEDVATPEGWRRNPEMVLRFYNERRKGVKKAQPNPAHKALAELEKKYKVVIITQNIDDLHERAGSTHVMHLHGEIMKAQSSQNPNIVYLLGDKEINMGDKCEYGSQLRPHVVWFGEAVPMIERAAFETQNADIFMVIGTSMAVYPAAGLIKYAPENALKYIIDPKIPGSLYYENLKLIPQKASIGVKMAVDELLK